MFLATSDKCSEVKSHLGTFVRGGLKHPYPLGYCFKGTLWQGGQILDKGWERRITNICKSCYLHIKCFPANSLAALMWRWYMNSKQSSLTASGRRFREVWDGIGRSSHNPIYTCTVRMVLKSWYMTWKVVKRKEEIEKHIENRLKNTTKKEELHILGYTIQTMPMTIFISSTYNYPSKPFMIVTSFLYSS